MSKDGYVLNLRGSGFEMLLNRGFKTAEELTTWVSNNSGRYPNARFDVIRVPDLAATMSDVSRNGALARIRVAGERVLNATHITEFVSKRAELAVKIGTAVGATVVATGSAYAATGDFNRAARAGYDEARTGLGATLNPQNSFGRAGHNIAGGVREGNLSRVGSGLLSGIEGAGRLVGIGGVSDWAERDRVLPAAERIFRERGARALTSEVIRTQENPKYILEANDSLPDRLPVSIGSGRSRELPLDQALRNNDTYNTYMSAINRRIASSTGDQREMWEGQRDSIQGYRQALSAQGDLAMPNSPAVGRHNGALHGLTPH